MYSSERLRQTTAVDQGSICWFCVVVIGVSCQQSSLSCLPVECVCKRLVSRLVYAGTSGGLTQAHREAEAQPLALESQLLEQQFRRWPVCILMFFKLDILCL